jgi:phosphoglycerate dehydrogenase-like enzyme
MRRIIIASQLTEEFNRAFLGEVQDVDIVAIPRGRAPIAPPQAQVMFGSPFHRAGSDRSYPPPAGWPFGIKWIQLISAGIDLYPPWLFDGPVVTSSRGVSAQALAEFSLAAIFAAAKRFPEVWIHEAALWKPSRISLVAGATLGIVGFGAIGEALAPKALALGMNVLVVRRTNQPLPGGVERAAGLADLFSRADHVVLACAATVQTNGMVDETLLAHAKEGLHLINVARGSLIDDAALLAALDSGRVRLATLDCTDPEPLTAGHAYYTHRAVRLSPHTSSYTPDAQPKLIERFVRNLALYRSGEPLEAVVDPDAGY